MNSNKEKVITTRLTDDEYNVISEKAKNEDRTISNMLRVIVKKYIKDINTLTHN